MKSVRNRRSKESVPLYDTILANRVGITFSLLSIFFAFTYLLMSGDESFVQKWSGLLPHNVLAFIVVIPAYLAGSFIDAKKPTVVRPLIRGFGSSPYSVLFAISALLALPIVVLRFFDLIQFSTYLHWMKAALCVFFIVFVRNAIVYRRWVHAYSVRLMMAKSNLFIQLLLLLFAVLFLVGSIWIIFEFPHAKPISSDSAPPVMYFTAVFCISYSFSLLIRIYSRARSLMRSLRFID